MQLGFVCSFDFLKSSSRGYHGRPQDRASDNFMCCHTWDRAGRPWLLSQLVTLYCTPNKAIGSGRPQQESNPGPPHQESRALPTELPAPPLGVWQRRGNGKRANWRESCLCFCLFYFNFNFFVSSYWVVNSLTSPRLRKNMKRKL